MKGNFLALSTDGKKVVMGQLLMEGRTQMTAPAEGSCRALPLIYAAPKRWRLSGISIHPLSHTLIFPSTHSSFNPSIHLYTYPSIHPSTLPSI